MEYEMGDNDIAMMDLVCDSERQITSFKDLRVWQVAMELTQKVYSVCGDFPKEEVYGLTSQIKRAVVSLPSNIAEGHSRQYKAEFRHFIFVAIGSLAELETQLQIAKQLGYCPAESANAIFEKVNHLRAMLLTLGNRLI